MKKIMSLLLAGLLAVLCLVGCEQKPTESDIVSSDSSTTTTTNTGSQDDTTTTTTTGTLSSAGTSDNGTTSDGTVPSTGGAGNATTMSKTNPGKTTTKTTEKEDDTMTTTTTTTKPTTTTTRDPNKPISSGEWKQEQFYIGTGYSPYSFTDKLIETAYEAGYNLISFEYWIVRNDERMHEALDICDEIGMNAFVGAFASGGAYDRTFTDQKVREIIHDYARHESVIGYDFWDEMVPEAFSRGKELNDWIKKNDPAKLAYSCLLPSYGPLSWNPQQQEASEYLTYVDDYLKTIDPDVISFDYYPFAGGSTIGASDWYRDMGLYRVKSLEYDKPFWYWYQSVDMANAPNYLATIISEGQIRVGMYTGLAYGAKGLLAWLGKGYAYDTEGNKLSRFNECKNINAEVMTVGQYLFDKTTTQIYHTGLPKNKDYNAIYYLDDLASSDLIASAPSGLIISIFEDGKTNTKYMLVVNKNYSFAQTGNIVLKNACKIEKLNAKNGKVTTVSDSSDTITLSLSKGNAALYVIK